MKFRKAYLFFLIPLVLVIIVFSGPRINLSLPEYRSLVPESKLDKWLQEQEALAGNVIQGTEKKILWADTPDKKTDIALVNIHGFGSSRQELVQIIKLVAKNIGANSFMTRLKGCGLGPQGYIGVQTGDWVNDTREAADIGKKIGRRVFFIAASTGAPLVMKECFDDPVYEGVILLSPNFKPANKSSEIILWPWGKLLVKAIVGEYRERKPYNEFERKYSSWKHHFNALFPMMGSVAIARNLPFESMKVPLLVLYTENDRVVSVEAIKKFYSRMGSSKKELINYTKAKRHQFFGGMSDGIWDEKIVIDIVNFIRKVDSKNN